MKKMILSLVFVLLNFSLVFSNFVNHNSNLFRTFNPIVGFDISAADETGIVLSTTNSVDSKYDCFLRCSTSSCLMVSFKANVCKLYTAVRFTSTLTVSEPCLYTRQNINFAAINANLISHWPFNNNFFDVQSNRYLYDPVSASFTTDRFNNPTSALFLNNGYLSAPPGMYFSGDYSVTAWVRVPTTARALLIDFAGKDLENEVSVGMSLNGNGKPYVLNLNPTRGNSGQLISDTTMTLNKWQHLAVSQTGTTCSIYLDGVLVKTGTQISPSNATRTNNYIGRVNWPPFGGSTVAIDDLKIFNRALSQSEIMLVLNSYF